MVLRDRLSLRVLEAGPPEGPAVLLLHGWAVSAYLWRHNIPALAAAGFRVYAPDLPGHGLSDAPVGPGACALAPLTSHTLALMDALQLDRVPIVAQSMGARVALELGRLYPDRVARLALFGPVGFGDISERRAYAPFVPVLPGALPSLIISRRIVEIVQRRVHGKLGWFTERDIDEYWAPTQFSGNVRAQLQMLREFDWEPHEAATLATVRVPTLVVFGTLDRTVRPARAERLVAAMAHGRLEWIEHGGHVVMEEVAERVNLMLIGFLQG
ncbi:MAG: alpha/beta fold hydrolase [Gemmatimonadales bacterium]